MPSDELPSGADPAVQAWYDREDSHVEHAIEMICVYQFKMPDGIGPFRRGPWPNHWWDEFWRSLEREAVVDQRREFTRRWQERHAPGGRQTRLDEQLGVDPNFSEYILGGQVSLEHFAEGGALADG